LSISSASASLAALLFLSLLPLHAAPERLTITGTVLDEATKQPLAGATILVHSAGVRTGYDSFCPTCYLDCGKRGTTDTAGNFQIEGLSPDLVFTMLVIRDGYSSVFVNKHDPQKGPAATTLKPRPPVTDPKQTVRGKVVDTKGRPVKEALISQQGIRVGDMQRFGDGDWIDLMAVSNKDGEFEIAYKIPATSMILEVTPRGMAPTLVTLSTGPERHPVTVTEGASVRGRLTSGGKPVANAEMLLSSHRTIAGTRYADIRIGTNANGEFLITNVPPGRVWDLAPRMESLAPKGLAAPLTHLETKDDGHEIKVPDIEVSPAHTIRGRIRLADDTPIPPNMRIGLNPDRGSDRQVQLLPPDGTFEFKGVGKGIYTLSPSVKGYRAPNAQYGIEFLVEGDRNNFVITLHPIR
jgi:hypothetical protein